MQQFPAEHPDPEQREPTHSLVLLVVRLRLGPQLSLQLAHLLRELRARVPQRRQLGRRHQRAQRRQLAGQLALVALYLRLQADKVTFRTRSI